MRASRYLTWIILILILVLLNLPSSVSVSVKQFFREIVSPFHELSSGLGERVGESFSVFVDPLGRTREEERQARDLADLRRRQWQLESLERDNGLLRSHLEYRRNSPFPLVAAEVIARGEASGWWEAVTVNKGEADGVTVGLAVLTPEGLVGRTASVTRHTSDVLLLTDRNCAVAAEMARSGEFGVLRGQGSGVGDDKGGMGYPPTLCRLDYLPNQAALRPGDRVVTSGLGGIFPRGLLVGVVQAAAVHRSGLYQFAYVRPAADLARLRYVFVARKSDRGAPSSEESVAERGKGNGS